MQAESCEIVCPPNYFQQSGVCLQEIACPPGQAVDMTKGLRDLCVTATGCLPQPCANGGVCSPRGASGYSCTCAAGFSGSTCNISGCSANPCKHGGTCNTASAPTNFTCDCQGQYTGITCDILGASDTALSSSSSSSAGVAAGVGAGVGILVLIIVIVVLKRRSHRKTSHNDMMHGGMKGKFVDDDRFELTYLVLQIRSLF